jgi:hypothetical protein
MKINPIHAMYILIGVLGVWLIYWNITEFMVTGLDTGVWDFDIIHNGLTSIVVGIILVGVFFYRGIRVLL